MFRKNRGLIFTAGVIILFLVIFLNKDYFVTEHMVNLTTATTLKAELDKTNENVLKLQKEFKDMNDNIKAQSGQAAAAKAQLAAMN